MESSRSSKDPFETSSSSASNGEWFDEEPCELMNRTLEESEDESGGRMPLARRISFHSVSSIWLADDVGAYWQFELQRHLIWIWWRPSPSVWALLILHLNLIFNSTQSPRFFWLFLPLLFIFVVSLSCSLFRLDLSFSHECLLVAIGPQQLRPCWVALSKTMLFPLLPIPPAFAYHLKLKKEILSIRLVDSWCFVCDNSSNRNTRSSLFPVYSIVSFTPLIICEVETDPAFARTIPAARVSIEVAAVGGARRGAVWTGCLGWWCFGWHDPSGIGPVTRHIALHGTYFGCRNERHQNTGSLESCVVGEETSPSPTYPTSNFTQQRSNSLRSTITLGSRFFGWDQSDASVGGWCWHKRFLHRYLCSSHQLILNRQLAAASCDEGVVKVAEVLVRRLTDDRHFLELRLAFLGGTDAGKVVSLNADHCNFDVNFIWIRLLFFWIFLLLIWFLMPLFWIDLCSVCRDFYVQFSQWHWRR